MAAAGATRRRVVKVVGPLAGSRGEVLTVDLESASPCGLLAELLRCERRELLGIDVSAYEWRVLPPRPECPTDDEWAATHALRPGDTLAKHLPPIPATIDGRPAAVWLRVALIGTNYTL